MSPKNAMLPREIQVKNVGYTYTEKMVMLKHGGVMTKLLRVSSVVLMNFVELVVFVWQACKLQQSSLT